MNETQTTLLLARAMRGDIGEAMRQFLGRKMAEAVSAISGCGGNNAAFLAGVIRGQQIIAQGLEGMDVAAQMMEE